MTFFVPLVCAYILGLLCAGCICTWATYVFPMIVAPYFPSRLFYVIINFDVWLWPANLWQTLQFILYWVDTSYEDLPLYECTKHNFAIANFLVKICIFEYYDDIACFCSAFFPLDVLVTAEITEPYFTHYNATAMLILWTQIISLAILTIWARGVGPRFRPDQLSDLTWKDLLIFLGGLLICCICLFH